MGKLKGEVGVGAGSWVGTCEALNDDAVDQDASRDGGDESLS